MDWGRCVKQAMAVKDWHRRSMNSTGFIPDSRRAFADASCRLKLISLLFKVNSRLDKVIEWPPGLTLSLKKVP